MSQTSRRKGRGALVCGDLRQTALYLLQKGLVDGPGYPEAEWNNAFIDWEPEAPILSATKTPAAVHFATIRRRARSRFE